MILPRGRVIVIGPATLILGDAYEETPKLGRCHLVMDPPYKFSTSGGGKFRAARGHTDQIADEGLDQGFDHSIINPMLHESVIVFCHNDQVARLSSYLEGTYGRAPIMCMWQKTNPMPVANKNYQPDSEVYFHVWNGEGYPRGDLADKKRIVTTPVGRCKDTGHATVKPDAVMEKIIRNVAPGLIVDPFMGTGSTLRAAVRAGRKCVGIEHNPKHYETAVARVREAQA